MPESVPEKLESEAIGYQISLLRIEAGMRQKTVAAIEDLRADLIGTLAKAGDLSPAKKKKLNATLAAASKQIDGAYKQIENSTFEDLEGVAQLTTKKTTADLSGALNVSFGPMQLSPAQASAIARGPVVEGTPMESWWEDQSRKFKRDFAGQIRQGMFLGEGTDELTRRIRGTKKNNYQDGLIVETRKREAESLVRTAVQATANTAKLETLNNGSEVIKGIKWVATLDNRTSATCRGISGLQWRLPDYKPIGHDKAFPGPIAHFGCRSTQVAVLRSWDELAGKKLPGADGETFRENFEKRLAAKGKTPEEIATIEAHQRASMDGPTDDSQDFDKWARKKGDDYIESLIGPGRFKLWKENNLSMRDLTDQRGRELTIEQLSEAIDSGELPRETEGEKFLPYQKPKEKQAADPIQVKIADTAYESAMEAVYESPEDAKTLRSEMEAALNQVSASAVKEMGKSRGYSGSAKAIREKLLSNFDLLSGTRRRKNLQREASRRKKDRLKTRPQMVSSGDVKPEKSEVSGKASNTFEVAGKSYRAMEPEQPGASLEGQFTKIPWTQAAGFEQLDELDLQEATLNKLSRADGWFFDNETISNLEKNSLSTAQGNEHAVYMVEDDSTNRWAIRATTNEQYGLPFKTPAQYLERLAKFNEFSPETRIEVIGFGQNSRGNGILFTRQPFVEGRKPTQDELSSGLKAKGYEPTGGHSWKHAETGTELHDVSPDNVLVSDDGNRLYPIDIWVE